MNEVELEHRLTVIEQMMMAGFERNDRGQKTIALNIEDLTNRVGQQNHRIEKLEENVAVMETKPPGYISKAQADKLLAEHSDLWSVWRFSRWFIPISIPLTIAIVEVLNHLGFFEALARR